MSGTVAEDPFAPEKEHASLLREFRVRARTDAGRHAEDIMERDLPIVAEAEALGEHRLVRLGLRRQKLIEEARSALVSATQTQERAEQRLLAALAALAAEGVPQEQLALEALDRPISPTLVAVAFGAAAIAAAIGGAFWLGAEGATIAVLVCVACASALVAAVFMPSGHRAETARMSALRRERRDAAHEVGEARGGRLDAERELEALPERAQNLLDGETRFVEELVAAYASELFRALPPGALADGRGLGEQRKPRLTRPGWAQPGGDR